MTPRILRGDCIEAMREMDEASVDAIVTDPPYGLRFMGKAWDGADIEQAARARAELGDDGEGGRLDGRTAPRSRGARDAGTYDLSLTGNRAFQAWTEDWAREAFRVLRPGGHLLCFAGSRTYHRMASGVEDAGFEIRDSLIWLYGSGFPKSLDVSKAIDKAAGAEREVVAVREAPAATGGVYGEYAQEVEVTEPATVKAQRWQGWGTALKPSHEPIVVARKPLVGTVAANVTEHGTGALNVDGCRIEGTPRATGTVNAHAESGVHGIYGSDDRTDRQQRYDENLPGGRWPANVILSPETAEELDRQSGESTSRAGEPRTGQNGDGWGMIATGAEYDDRGGASRFFYTAKASREERNAGLDGFDERTADPYGEHRGRRMEDKSRIDGKPAKQAQNVHPTVKPIDLMRWLCRLVTPPGGMILDPFNGSGTTGIAAHLEGFRFLGIEREAEYVEIARARLAWWSKIEPGTDVDAALGFSARERAQTERGQTSLLEEAA